MNETADDEIKIVVAESGQGPGYNFQYWIV